MELSASKVIQDEHSKRLGSDSACASLLRGRMVTIARCHTVVAASAVPRERDIALSLVWNVTRKVSATCPVRFAHTSLQTWRWTECGGCAIDGLRVLATVARYRR